MTTGVVGRAGPSDGTFVGRERERAALDEALDAVLDGGGRLVFITGEPGIGKTRLAGEVADSAARRGARTYWGRCWEGDGAPPLWPWVQVLRSYARGVDAPRLLKEAADGAPELARVVPEIADVLDGQSVPTVAESEEARFRFFDAATTFLRNAAQSEPVVIILDDLHWSDGVSLELLRFLARELRHGRLLVIGTFREADLEQVTELSHELGKILRLGLVLPLRGLTREDVVKLIASIGVDADEGLVDEVFRVTEGNPFFVDAVARSLLADPQPARETTARLPLGVREMVRDRLRTLPTETREALTIASVVGREFLVGVIEDVLGCERRDVVELLAPALSSGMLDVVGISLGAYSFSHALVRETLYADVPADRLPELHLRVARALERFYGSNVEAHVSEVAAHFAQAASIAGDDAVRYGIRAAQAVREQLAFEESEAMLVRTLDMVEFTSEPDAARCDVLLELGKAQVKSAAFKRASPTFQRAWDVACALDDPDRIGRAAVGYTSATTEVGEFDLAPAAIEMLRRALDALPESEIGFRAEILGRLSHALHFVAPPDETVALARAGLLLAESSGDPEVLHEALSQLWWTLMDAADHAERVDVANTLVASARARASDRHLLEGLGHQLHDRLESGDLRAVDEAFALYDEVWQRVRLPGYGWTIPTHHAARALLEGRFDAVRVATDDSAEKTELVNSQILASVSAWLGFLRAWELGVSQEIDRALEAVVPYAELMPSVRDAVVALSLAEAGRFDDVRAIVQAIEPTRFHEIPRGMSWLGTISCFAGACAVVEDVERCAVLYAMLEPFAELHPTVPTIAAFPNVSMFLGMLASACRWDDDARAHLEAALRRHQRMGARPWIARTSAELGDLLVRTGDIERAREHIQTAYDIASELGMQALARRVEALLESAPAPEERGGQAETLRAVLRLEGEFWTVGRPPKVFRVQDSKGMRAVHRLLSTPGAEVHAAELVAAVEGHTGNVSTVDPRREAIGGSSDDAGPVLDETARDAYRARLAELREDLEEAEAFQDTVRAERARDEIDALTTELSRSFGLGGRARKASSVAERARVNVTRFVKRALDAIAAQDADLAHHLRTCVKTGVFCSYDPDPLAPVAWEL